METIKDDWRDAHNASVRLEEQGNFRGALSFAVDAALYIDERVLPESAAMLRHRVEMLKAKVRDAR